MVQRWESSCWCYQASARAHLGYGGRSRGKRWIASDLGDSEALMVEPMKIIFLLIEDTIPQKRIESYSVLGSIVSTEKKLLKSSIPYITPPSTPTES